MRLQLKSLPITVTNQNDVPISFIWKGQKHTITKVGHIWRWDVEWWRVRFWRDYYKVSTDTGYLVVIYHDLLDDGWYLERTYD